MMSRVLIFLVGLYQTGISPLIGGGCRFSPNCSSYAREALLRHGAMRGILLAGGRILRCHPWGRSGEDPVP